MNLKHVCLAALFGSTLLATSCDKDDDAAKEDVNPQDESFIISASRSNRAEVELGTLAQQKGTDNSVKNFAQMMVSEHTTAQTELVSIYNLLATNADINDSLDNDQKAMRTMLQSMPAGRAFDSAYIAGQSAAHQKTLTVFDAEIAGGQNTRVIGYATSKRPSIAMHKVMADSILTRITQ